MLKFKILLGVVMLCNGIALAGDAQVVIQVELELPALQVDPYFKPYVAVWLETPKRDYVATLCVWYNESKKEGGGTKWLKDILQWWRKSGSRTFPEIDGTSGATKRPGNYRILWDGKDSRGDKVPNGDYFLNFEAVREDGGREFKRQAITLGQQKTIELSGASELKKISIQLNERP